jgi:methyltransferase (TIGR00027 family)
MKASSNGVRQIVIVGTGLDGRAFRLPLPTDATTFEIDRADIFELEDTLLTEAGLLPHCRRQTIAADIADPEWIAALSLGGWQHDQPTLWLLEGLLIYLSVDPRTFRVETLRGAGGLQCVTYSRWDRAPE